MNKKAANHAQIILVLIIAVCLTFSFSAFTRLVPDTVTNPTLARMSLWTPFILVLHLLYRSLVLRKELFLPYRIAIITTVVVLVLAGVAILVALAIWLPSARHDRLDMLYIIGIGVVGEEILFRGLLWDIVDSYLVNNGFRFLHISGTVWLTALAFGVMRLRTESVLWPIFAHAGLNALFNLALTFSATAYPTFTSM